MQRVNASKIVPPGKPRKKQAQVNRHSMTKLGVLGGEGSLKIRSHVSRFQVGSFHTSQGLEVLGKHRSTRSNSEDLWVGPNGSDREELGLGFSH